MNLNRDGIDAEIAESAEGLLQRSWDLSQLRATDNRLPASLWSQAADVGWFDVLVPAASDGLGLGLVAAGAICEAAGRHLLPGPLLETILLSPLCPGRIHTGSSRALGAALRERGSEASVGWSRATVHDGSVTGEKVLVPYADDTGLLVVSAGGAVPIIGIVDRAVPGVDITVHGSADLTDRPCTVRFEETPIEVIAESEAALRMAATLEVGFQVLTASRLVGVIDRLAELSTAYAADREQFGRPIGSFQATQHRLADMHWRATVARSASYVAQVRGAAADAQARRWAAVAKAFASRTGRHLAEAALQVHGGIGFTADHDLHLYFKHALALQSTWGDERHHEEVVLSLLRDDVGAFAP